MNWTIESVDAHLAKMRRIYGKSPDVPGEIADEGPESRLQSRIVAYCKEWGWPCVSFRQSTHAKGFLTPGTPDLIIAAPGGVSLWIELKGKKGRLSEDQKQFALALMALPRQFCLFVFIYAGQGS